MTIVKLPSEQWRRKLYLPAYTIADAARYAGTTKETVRYWHYRGGQLGPALPGRERGKPLSYLQLIEVAVVATFRRSGLSLQKIRKARDYLAQMFNEEFPFARYRLQTDGCHILFDWKQIEPDAELDLLIVADQYGQVAWKDLIIQRFKEFDYEDGLAVRWHPAGQKLPVVIDPRVSFGAPTVKGIPTWAIKGRKLAGESIEPYFSLTWAFEIAGGFANFGSGPAFAEVGAAFLRTCAPSRAFSKNRYRPRSGPRMAPNLWMSACTYAC